MLDSLDKEVLLKELLARMESDLEVVTRSQQESQAGATHEDAKAEGDKDMRSTEISYVARGMAKRVVELRTEISRLATLKLRNYSGDDKLGLSALILVEDEEEREQIYFLSPCGGGISLSQGKEKISVITPDSPIGRAFVGLREGDDVELSSPQGMRYLSILEVA